jgi:hypothetical protein
MSRFRFDARSSNISGCVFVSDSADVISLSFSVRDRFLLLVGSALVGCGVGVCREFILDAEEVK